MKETLLQRCQREAREKLQDFDFEQIWNDEGAENLNVLIDTLIANTLKQAAEAIEVMVKNNKDPYMFPLTERRFLTDAQKVLGVDLSE
jgi:hypothetical protein